MQRAEMSRREWESSSGGRSSEREISLRSGNAVREALIRKGYRTVAVDPGEGLVGDA